MLNDCFLLCLFLLFWQMGWGQDPLPPAAEELQRAFDWGTARGRDGMAAGWRAGLAGRPGARRGASGRAGSLGAALSTAFFLGCCTAVYCRDGKRQPGHEAGNPRTPSSSRQALSASSNEHYERSVYKPVSDVISSLEPILCSQVSN